MLQARDELAVLTLQDHSSKVTIIIPHTTNITNGMKHIQLYCIMGLNWFEWFIIHFKLFISEVRDVHPLNSGWYLWKEKG